MGIIMSLVVGGICGWLAGKIMKSNNGILFNIILGLLGGCLGGLLFGILGFATTGIIGNIISGVVGSCILVALVRYIKKK